MSTGIHSGNPYNDNDWILAPNHWAQITDRGEQEGALLCPDCAPRWWNDHFDADYEGEESGYRQTGGNLDDFGVPRSGDGLEYECAECGRVEK